MNSVTFGQTGLTVSRLCFGTAYLGPLGEKLTPEAGGELLAHAFELGVTFWDTSDDYGTHPHIAAALRRVPRERVVIASKTYEPKGTVKRALHELGTDYLDVMLIHCVGLNWIEPARRALGILERDKAQGLVRAVGFSTHSAEVCRRAAKWPEVEVLLAVVNPTGTWDQNEQIEDGTIADMLDALERAHAAGKGVYAMKVLGRGALASDPAQAIGFAARLPYVHSLCIGMRSLDEVRRNVSLLDRIAMEAL
jgi:aryl-alcohol dehydrogenase-like predicted oxidoreductase